MKKVIILCGVASSAIAAILLLKRYLEREHIRHRLEELMK